jgi:hypothetical protein
MIMNKYLNKLRFPIFLLLAGIILLFTTGCPRCKDNNCVDIEIGSASPADSSSAWIPFNAHDTVSFINSYGFSAQFFCSAYQQGPYEKLLADGYDENCGDPMEECWKYYTMYYKSLNFTSPSVNLTIEYKLRKNISDYTFYHSTINPDTISDALMISINNFYWVIPLKHGNNTNINCTTELLDSLILNGSVYHNVYHSTQNYNPGGVAIKEIYYTKVNGIIGFNYTNDEKWYLQ